MSQGRSSRRYVSNSTETSVFPKVWGVFRVDEPLLTFEQRMCLVCVVCKFGRMQTDHVTTGNSPDCVNYNTGRFS